MLRTLLLCGPMLILATALACPPEERTAAQTAPPDSQTAEPTVTVSAAESRIDVVFVLDTTGSMGGLIEGAKQKIWSIANTIATAEPRPQIRMGLVAYRDRGDEYITRLTPLTDDLDAVYADLMGFVANGGGDGPESVNQALHEAVTRFDWTDLPGALKLIYLVGDAPPHMDYEDDVKFDASCELAARQGIIINTIQCGSYADTTPIWQQIARLAEGEFFQVDQSGGAVAIATPMDDELNRLNRALEETVVPYGSADEIAEQRARDDRAREVAAAAPSAALAERAIYKASAAGVASLIGRQELVQDCLDKKVSIAELPAEQLPEAMRNMTVPQRQEYIQTKASERAQLQQQIKDISTERSAFITRELAAAGSTKDAFDTAIIKALRAQAARFGIAYPAEAK